MTKLVLSDVVSGFATTTLINSNNTAIKTALENTLSRDGTSPNQMESALDMNGNMILNQANPITVTGFNWEGPWITATLYQIGDVVENNNSSYIAIVEHTSGVFATDLAAAKWQVVSSSAALPSQGGHNGDVLSTDGSNASWVDVNSLALPISGGTLTGGLNGTTANFSSTLNVDGQVSIGTATPLVFEGATANSFETSIAVVDPTLDRTITIPDADVDLTKVRAATTSLDGVSRYATNAEVLAGTSTTTSVTPSNILSGYDLGNGELVLPGGFRLKWGTDSATLGAGASRTITFVTPFPTAQVYTGVSVQSSSVNSQMTLPFVTITALTGFSVANNDTDSHIIVFRWFSIGH